MTQKLSSLEMLRALAALLVVLFHSETIFATAGHVPFHGLFSAGDRGVDLFFVLSGFIIAYVHRGDLGRPNRIGRYLFNRVSRIYPAVWIMTLLALGLYELGFGGASKAGKLDPSAIAASFLLVAQHGAPLVNVTWTLTYEIAFYAIFAVAIVHLRLGLALLVLWQAVTLVLAVGGFHSGFAGYYLRPICLEFSLGLGAAWWLLNRRAARNPLVHWLTVAFGIAAFILGMVLVNVIDWSAAFCAAGAAAMIIGVVRLEQAGRLTVPSPLARLGGASYAIYIVHYSVITLLAALLVHKLHMTVTDPLCLGCAAVGICCGLGFDWLIDRPIQRGLRRGRERHRPRPVVALGAGMEPAWVQARRRRI